METTAARVARNVKRLRDERRFTVRSLSARLGDLGNPILPSGISKIENGTRRVDVDDLVALAIAFEVSPVALLLPSEPTGAAVGLTAKVTASWQACWRWMCGEQPLMTGRKQVRLDSPRVRAFISENRPYEEAPFIHEVARGLITRNEFPGSPFTALVRHDGTTTTTRLTYGDDDGR